MIVFKILLSFCILILAVRAEGETVGSSKALNPVLAVPNDNGNRTIQGYSEGCESDKVATGEQLECTHVDQCYPPHQRCDGKYHCTDESDEIGCVCTAEQFSCKADDKCINKEFICNGYEDCSDGADETGYCALYKDLRKDIEDFKNSLNKQIQSVKDEARCTNGYKVTTQGSGKKTGFSVVYSVSFGRTFPGIPQVLTSINGVHFGKESTDTNDNRGYKIANGLVYMFVNDKKTYKDALDNCVNRGGTLATARSRQNYDFIKNNFGTHRMWIGHKRRFEGTILSKGGKFGFSNGGLVTVNDWYTGEPNNQNGIEDCVEMNYGGAGKLNDVNCADKFPYLCEIPLSQYHYTHGLPNTEWGMSVKISSVTNTGFKATVKGEKTEISYLNFSWIACY